MEDKDLEKYKLKDTHGVLVVTLYQFADAVIKNYTINNAFSSVDEYDDYYVLKAHEPYYKCGYYYTLLLEKEISNLNDLMYEIFWQIDEINKEEKRKILKKLKEELDIE
jgi:hypothetical protein